MKREKEKFEIHSGISNDDDHIKKAIEESFFFKYFLIYIYLRFFLLQNINNKKIATVKKARVSLVYS